MRTSLLLAACIVGAGFAFAVTGCPAPAQDTKYPARKEGCDVTVFHETPSVMSENIGPVMATCSDDIKDEDCLRTLKDQVCKLGGDIVWGVDDVPSKVQGKKKLAGRAAHTQSAGK